MTKYLSIATLILLVSCKQEKGNLVTQKDTIQSSQDKTPKIEKNIDYEAIWDEAIAKMDSEFSANYDSIAKNFEEYVPSGFSVESVSTGDANLDGLSDTILIVRNKADASATSTLLLFIKQKDGSNKFTLINYDILGGDNSTVKIDNGRIFIFEQYNAGVEISFFKFDEATEKWIFIETFSSGLAGNGEITKAEGIVTLDK